MNYSTQNVLFELTFFEIEFLRGFQKNVLKNSGSMKDVYGFFNKYVYDQ